MKNLSFGKKKESKAHLVTYLDCDDPVITTFVRTSREEAVTAALEHAQGTLEYPAFRCERPNNTAIIIYPIARITRMEVLVDDGAQA
jgi:hypothetical protein